MTGNGLPAIKRVDVEDVPREAFSAKYAGEIIMMAGNAVDIAARAKNPFIDGPNDYLYGLYWHAKIRRNAFAVIIRASATRSQYTLYGIKNDTLFTKKKEPARRFGRLVIMAFSRIGVILRKNGDISDIEFNVLPTGTVVMGYQLLTTKVQRILLLPPEIVAMIQPEKEEQFSEPFFASVVSEEADETYVDYRCRADEPIRVVVPAFRSPTKSCQPVIAAPRRYGRHR